MPYDYIEEYQKQDDETIWEFRDKDAQSKIDISLTETDYANPLSLETMQAQHAKNTKIKLEPIQDLHGYDKPWVGGAGKNLLPMTVEVIKPLNTSGSWSGNVYTLNGVTFTIQTDNDGNIISITTNGTASATTNLNLNKIPPLPNTNLILSGCPSGGTSDTYGLRYSNYADASVWDTGNGKTFTPFNYITYPYSGTDIAIYSGVNVSNKIWYPMIRLATESDATFQPYTNIASITGHDQIDILGCGKNLFNKNDSSSTLNAYIGGVITANDNTRTVFIKCEPSTIYTVSKTAGQRFTVAYTKELPADGITMYGSINNNTASSITITTGADAKYIVAYVFNSSNDSGTAEQMLTSVQIEKNNQATEYEPYQESNNLSIDLPSTVYGGVLDLESGEVNVTDGYVSNLGDLTWETTTVGGNHAYKSNALPNVLKSGTGVRLTNCLCSHYEVSNTGDDKTCFVFDQDGRFYIRDTSCLSAADLKTSLNGGTLTYKVIPFTLYISPEHLKLLKAQNTITTSQYTQVKVTYRNGVFATLEELSDTANGIYNEISGDTTTASGNPINFTTREKQKSKSTIIDLKPIQDLHGFTKPWVGGAEKNLCVMTVEELKAANVYGTWSGNVYTYKAVTYTILTDSDNNVIGIKVNGTASDGNPIFNIQNGISLNGNYILSGCPSGGSNMTYRMDIRTSNPTTVVVEEYGIGASFTASSGTDVFACIRVQTGVQVTNLIFYPMIRLSTVTDSTFEPYTNIANISGRSSVDINGCGKNLLKLNQLTATTINGLTMTPVYSNGKLDYLNFNGTLSATTDFVIGGTFGVKQRFIFLGKGITYTFSRLYKNTGVQLLMRDGAENVITPNTDEYTFTLDKDTEIGSIFFRFSAAKYENIKIYPQIEAGSSASLYEPYTPSTDLTISFGTTVYGGRLDVEKGELVVDRGIADLGDLDWSLSDAAQHIFRSASLTSTIKIPDSGTDIPNDVCSIYYIISWSSISANTNGRFAIASKGDSYAGRIVCIDHRYSSTSDFTTGVTGQKVVYELATPQIIQLTPQQVQLLKGINNISTTGTTITVTFKNGSVAHLDDLPENVFTDLDKEKLASIDTLAITLDLLTHTLVVTQDI